MIEESKGRTGGPNAKACFGTLTRAAGATYQTGRQAARSKWTRQAAQAEACGSAGNTKRNFISGGGGGGGHSTGRGGTDWRLRARFSTVNLQSSG